MAVSAGDVRKNGLTDLVFAAKDSLGGQECSWYYPQINGTWPETQRVPIKSYRANDIVLTDLGGKNLSLVIMQSNIITSYDGSTLLYKEFTGRETLLNDVPVKLPCGDARMILTPRMQKHCQLVLPHTRTGNATGLLPVVVYTGKDGKFALDRKIEFMANGAMDGVFADLDDNGYPDIIIANEVEMSPHLNDGSYIYFQNRNGFEKTPLKLPTQFATGIVVADFNKDGVLDIVFTSLGNDLTMYYGLDNRQFKRHDIKLGKGCQTLWLACADLNLDGYLDLAVPTIAGKSCILWGSQDGFDYKRRQDFNIPRAQNVKIADLNQDSYPDLLFCGVYPSIGKPHDSYVTIFYGSSDGFKDHKRTQLPVMNSNCLAVQDFNNDGLLDIFTGAYDSSLSRELDSHIYWNAPDEGFTKDNRSFLRTEAACGVIAADFNKDGYLDMGIVNHKVNTKHVSYSQVWYNNKGKFSSDNTIKLPTSGPHGMINTPLQNIVDRSPAEEYTSVIYQRTKTAEEFVATICADIPASCKVKLALRSADSVPGLQSIPFQRIEIGKNISIKDFSGKYLQYRLQLISRDGINTPKVRSVTFTFQ